MTSFRGARSGAWSFPNGVTSAQRIPGGACDSVVIPPRVPLRDLYLGQRDQYVELELDLLADQESAGLQDQVPARAELRSVDLACCRDSRPALAVGILGDAFELDRKDAYGKSRAAFSATGEIDRTEFGASWNLVLETGGFLVSKEIKLELDVLATLAEVEVP